MNKKSSKMPNHPSLSYMTTYCQNCKSTPSYLLECCIHLWRIYIDNIIEVIHRACTNTVTHSTFQRFVCYFVHYFSSVCSTPITVSCFGSFILVFLGKFAMQWRCLLTTDDWRALCLISVLPVDLCLCLLKGQFSQSGKLPLSTPSSWIPHLQAITHQVHFKKKWHKI